MEPIPEKTLLRWAESLAGVARTGLGFTESQYERERFEEVLKIAGDIKSAAEEGLDGVLDADGYVAEWMKDVGTGVAGYQTPKVAVGAAVTNDRGELLLIQRADSGVWLYPTGWCDVGYSAPEVVVKEVLEETGIEVEPVRLIGVLDGMRLGSSTDSARTHCCSSVAPSAGEMKIHPLEVHRRRMVHARQHADADHWRRTLGRADLRGHRRRTPRRLLRRPSSTGVARGPVSVTVEVVREVTDELVDEPE